MKLKVFLILCFVSLILILMRQFCIPCELLVLARNDTNESRGQYGKYDVVEVRADNSTYGSSEKDKNIFYIIKLPNVSVTDAQKYLVNTSTTPNIRRRDYEFDVTKIAVAEKNAIESSGKLELSVNKEELTNIITIKSGLIDIDN